MGPLLQLAPLTGDPLFGDGVDLTVFLIVAFKAVIAFAFLLVAVMLMIWFERKVVSDMQNRIGPNRAGPWGILQTLADGIKLFFKEDLVPDEADRFTFKLAPYLSLVPAFVTFAVVPVGGVFSETKPGTIELFGRETLFQVANPPVGVLVVLAMSSIAVYGVLLAGWSSGSKYPLLGAVRGSAQMVSYEAALGLTTVTVVLTAGTLTTNGIVSQQAGEGFGSIIPNWNLVTTGVVPFVLFMIAATAELNRPPFDLVEAEQELVGGFHTEYSAIRFALFFLAEFMNVITMSAIIVTLFLGGPSGPLLGGPDWIWPIVWFFSKLMVFLFGFVWLRATLPRLRYDQLMDWGWKALIPLALGWMLVISAIRIAPNEDWNSGVVIGVGLTVLFVSAGLLLAAVRSGTANYEAEEAGR